jgi:hypothetical protein
MPLVQGSRPPRSRVRVCHRADVADAAVEKQLAAQ